MSAFLGANKRWDAYYQKEASSKLASSAAILKHDTLVNDRPASADKDVLARTQYLVAKYIFLSQHPHASVADWVGHASKFSHQIPSRVAAFRWRTEDERDGKFSSSILRAVAPSGDAFRAQEHQLERSRHTYLQAMKVCVHEMLHVRGVCVLLCVCLYVSLSRRSLTLRLISMPPSSEPR